MDMQETTARATLDSAHWHCEYRLSSSAAGRDERATTPEKRIARYRVSLSEIIKPLGTTRFSTRPLIALQATSQRKHTCGKVVCHAHITKKGHASHAERADIAIACARLDRERVKTTTTPQARHARDSRHLRGAPLLPPSVQEQTTACPRPPGEQTKDARCSSTVPPRDSVYQPLVPRLLRTEQRPQLSPPPLKTSWSWSPEVSYPLW